MNARVTILPRIFPSLSPLAAEEVLISGMVGGVVVLGSRLEIHAKGESFVSGFSVAPRSERNYAGDQGW